MIRSQFKNSSTDLCYSGIYRRLICVVVRMLEILKCWDCSPMLRCLRSLFLKCMKSTSCNVSDNSRGEGWSPLPTQMMDVFLCAFVCACLCLCMFGNVHRSFCLNNKTVVFFLCFLWPNVSTCQRKMPGPTLSWQRGMIMKTYVVYYESRTRRMNAGHLTMYYQDIMPWKTLIFRAYSVFLSSNSFTSAYSFQRIGFV